MIWFLHGCYVHNPLNNVVNSHCWSRQHCSLGEVVYSAASPVQKGLYALWTGEPPASQCSWLWGRIWRNYRACTTMFTCDAHYAHSSSVLNPLIMSTWLIVPNLPFLFLFHWGHVGSFLNLSSFVSPQTLSWCIWSFPLLISARIKELYVILFSSQIVP